MKKLLRGELAKAANVSIETLRFYELQGVIPPPERAINGYRLYPETTLLVLEFISKAKTAGFTLAEIKTIFSIVDKNQQKFEMLSEFITKKITQIQQKKQELQFVEDHLAQMLNHLEEPEHCPLCKYFEIK